jgi:phospholipid/cholesterol/gamma-HCH transport system substrate-binding protein
VTATRPLRRSRLGPNATRVAIIAAIVLFALVALLLVSSSGGGTYELKAVFDDVRGLIPGGEVRAGAITVGRVTKVELNDQDEPEVTMRVSNDLPLHQGALANIRLGSNVGAVNRTVDLTQGDISKPELPRGTVLRGASTDQPVNFDNAIETLDPPTRADIKRFLIGLDAALKNRGPDFDRALANSSQALNETANLLAQVNQDGNALKTIVDQGNRVTAAIASSPRDLGGAVESTARLLATTGAREEELAESVRLLGPALANGRKTLDALASNTPELTELVDGLSPVAKQLQPFARELPKATRAGGPFLKQTRKLVHEGPNDLRRIEPIIDATEPIATDFPPVIQAAIPLAKDLTAYIPETIGFFQNFGAATGDYDKVGHVINLAIGAAQTPPPAASSNTIQSDQCTPGKLVKPFTRLPGTNECEPWRNFEHAYDDLVPKSAR